MKYILITDVPVTNLHVKMDLAYPSVGNVTGKLIVQIVQMKLNAVSVVQIKKNLHKNSEIF